MVDELGNERFRFNTNALTDFFRIIQKYLHSQNLYTGCSLIGG